MVDSNYFFHFAANDSVLIFEKNNFPSKCGFTSVLGNHTKENFGLNKAFLGETQQLIRRLFNQTSSFRMGTNKTFLIYEQLTLMLHYRILGFLTDRVFSLGVVSKFSFYLRVMKTQLFANV